MKHLLIIAALATPAAADPVSGPPAVPDAPGPQDSLDDWIKDKIVHPEFAPQAPQTRANTAAISEMRGAIKDNTTRADLALALSTIQIDFTQPNYLAGGLAYHDGSTVGAIGWNHRINNRASVGLMVGSDGSDIAVGVFGGIGF